MFGEPCSELTHYYVSYGQNQGRAQQMEFNMPTILSQIQNSEHLGIFSERLNGISYITSINTEPDACMVNYFQTCFKHTLEWRLML